MKEKNAWFRAGFGPKMQIKTTKEALNGQSQWQIFSNAGF